MRFAAARHQSESVCERNHVISSLFIAPLFSSRAYAYIYIHGEKIIPHLSTHSSLLSSTVSFIPLIIKAEIAIKNKKIERKIWLNIKMEWSGLEGIQQVCFLSHLSIPFPLLRYHEHADARQRCSFRYFFRILCISLLNVCDLATHTAHTLAKPFIYIFIPSEW